MRIFAHRKKLAAAVGIAAVGLSGAVAFAYWTTTGSGAGTGTVGTSSAVTIVGTAATTLYPGTTSTVTFTAANPGTGNQQISTIHLVSVQAYTSATTQNSTTLISGCGGTNSTSHDFSMPDVTVTNPDGDILAGATAQAISASGTLTMNDLSTNQDACKSAFLVLTLTSS